MPDRFDIFEYLFPHERRFLSWCGSFSSIEAAQESLRLCAEKSNNEFYVKDNATGYILARANVPEPAAGTSELSDYATAGIVHAR
jgi:hypothetical protein